MGVSVEYREFSVRFRPSAMPAPPAARTQMAMLRRIGYICHVRLLEAKWHNLCVLPATDYSGSIITR